MNNKIHEKIDTINDIIIEAFKNIKVHECRQQNNVYIFNEEFAVDCMEPKRAKIAFKVRDKFLANMCVISFERSGISIKYTTDFFWVLKEKRNSFELTCSVTANRKLDVGTIEKEFEDVFENTISQKIDLNYDKMMDVLEVLIIQYMDYKDKIENLI